MSALTYKVHNTQGKEIGSIDLDPEVFGAEPNASLVHQVVVWQRNKRRAGTHSTINKTAFEGSKKKPWKQKGSGRARAGGQDSPLWRGGAVAFGPTPRSYESRLSKRTRRQALVSVLSTKAKESSLIVVDDLSVSGKTKEVAAIIKALGAKTGGSVIVVDDRKGLVERSARNIAKVLPLAVEGVNVYDLLRHKYLVATKAGVKALERRVKKAEA